MQSGRVKKWLPKGYGFISMPNGEEIFVHVTACEGREFLNIDENVTFELGEDARTGKTRAVNVTGDGSGQEPDMSRNDNQGGRGGFGNRNQGGYQKQGGYGGQNSYGNQGGYGGQNNHGNQGGYGGQGQNSGYGQQNGQGQGYQQQGGRFSQ